MLAMDCNFSEEYHQENIADLDFTTLEKVDGGICKLYFQTKFQQLLF